MKRAVWVGVGIVVLVGIGGASEAGHGGSQAPASTTISPTVAPDGGEPGIVAGPPNPGFCAPGPTGDVRRTVHAVAPTGSTVVPRCR